VDHVHVPILKLTFLTLQTLDRSSSSPPSPPSPPPPLPPSPLSFFLLLLLPPSPSPSSPLSFLSPSSPPRRSRQFPLFHFSVTNSSSHYLSALGLLRLSFDSITMSPKSSMTSSSPREHVRDRTQRKQCPDCSALISYSNYARHCKERGHDLGHTTSGLSGERNRYRFYCGVCDKKYTRNTSLRRHQEKNQHTCGNSQASYYFDSPSPSASDSGSSPSPPPSGREFAPVNSDDILPWTSDPEPYPLFEHPSRLCLSRSDQEYQRDSYASSAQDWPDAILPSFPMAQPSAAWFAHTDPYDVSAWTQMDLNPAHISHNSNSRFTPSRHMGRSYNYHEQPDLIQQYNSLWIQHHFD
jgi:hypothetical protein